MISVTNLQKTYGGISALKGLEFEISKGEFVLIFGPNGAGKSTLFMILSTLLAPSHGEILINKVNLNNNTNEIRKIIGLVSHEPYLYENLSALENLKFFADLYDIDNSLKKAKELLVTLELEGREHELIRNYSRGMKQRVALARALIHEPDILLLDEPFSGLDIFGISIVIEILRKLKLAGKTILMSTHNYDESIDLADKIFVLVNGKIKLEISEIFSRDRFMETYRELIYKND